MKLIKYWYLLAKRWVIVKSFEFRVWQLTRKIGDG